VKYVCETHIGNVRETNEDYFTIYLPSNNVSGFFIIADGMGGHQAGDIASKMACDLLLKFLINKNDQYQDIGQLLIDGYLWVNQKLFEISYRNEKYYGMGTTLVTAAIKDNTVYIANVGDSRAYYISDRIYQITEDHSLVYQMYKNGDITKEEINIHPQKNIITRAVGISLDLKVDLFSFKYDNTLKLILCTDGLTNFVSEDYIFEVSKTYDIQTCASILMEQALQNGGRDNITMVIIENNIF